MSWFVAKRIANNDVIESEARQMMRETIKIYLQPAFLICAVVLATAGGSMSIAIKSFGVYLRKEPLPLKKPLQLLDEMKLSPYKVIWKQEIKNEQIIKELGTEDYIQWNLEDAGVSAESPVRRCSLFITYYGLPDVVPHVPEECYIGVGNQRLGSDSITFEVNKDGEKQKIPGKYLVFGSTGSSHWRSTKFPVMYIFNVNEKYANSREAVRIALNKNLFYKHSYFCKIEWKFFNQKYGSRIYPNKEDAIAAGQKLLSVILPVLEQEHWPDWKKTEDK